MGVSKHIEIRFVNRSLKLKMAREAFFSPVGSIGVALGKAPPYRYIQGSPTKAIKTKNGSKKAKNNGRGSTTAAVELD